MNLRTWSFLALGVALTVTPALATRSHRAATSGHARLSRHFKRGGGTASTHTVSHIIQGQRTIDADRTRQIQQALIDRNYLTGGEATGEWTADTEAAMTKFQADNGWQTKLMPDSRALIKLGLGPNSLPGVSGTSASSYSTPASTDANTLAAVHSILK